MREIKFQAWDLDAEQMYNWESIKQLFHEHLAHPRVKVRQYTGLKDRNGREIYEGDILQISNKENKDYHMEVLWTGQGFGYKIIRNETKRSGYIVGHHSERGLNFYNGASEVIGNIYEDSQLLEAAE